MKMIISIILLIAGLYVGDSVVIMASGLFAIAGSISAGVDAMKPVIECMHIVKVKKEGIDKKEPFI